MQFPELSAGSMSLHAVSSACMQFLSLSEQLTRISQCLLIKSRSALISRLRASVRTFNPKQLKYEDKSDTKFKFATFNKNVNRVKAATAGFDPDLAIRELKSILNWENKLKTSGVFVGYLLGVWFFEPWMITFGLLFPFIGNILFLTVTGGWNKDLNEEEEEEEDDSGDAKGEEKEKKSLKEKMDAIQEIALQIQVLQPSTANLSMLF